MPGGRPSVGTIAAVFFAALLFLVPLTYEATARTISIVGGLFGVSDPLAGLAGRTIRLGSIAAGFKVAADVASIRLAGYESLDQGPFAASLVSLLLLSWVAIASAVLAADFGYGLLVRGLNTGRLELLGAGLLLLVALGWALARSVRAFHRGYTE